jgi:hypothetical protein
MDLFMEILIADNGMAFMWLSPFCHKYATNGTRVNGNNSISHIAWDDSNSAILQYSKYIFRVFLR